MQAKDLTVLVRAGGYLDLVETRDPALCAKVLALLLAEAKPETAEQRLIRELEEKTEKADTRAILAEDRERKLTKQLDELKKSVEQLSTAQKAAPQFINGG